MTAPGSARRSTADIATQYVLADLDSEPLSAHAHKHQRSHSPRTVRASKSESNVVSTRLAASEDIRQLKSPQGLIKAQDLSSWPLHKHKDTAGMLTEHPFPDVAYSELEGSATAMEDQALQQQAEVKALQGANPHRAAASAQTTKAAAGSQQAAQSSPAKAAVDAADISISVMAGSHDGVPPGNPTTWVDANWGRASATHGAGAQRVKGSLGGQSPSAVRSPLHSVHEEHGMYSRASSTGIFHLSFIEMLRCMLECRPFVIQVTIDCNVHSSAQAALILYRLRTML